MIIPFRIVDIMFTGVHQFDSSFVYIPIETLQKALYTDEKGSVATSINIKLRPGVNPESAAEQIRELWQAFATQELDWSPTAVDLTAIKTAREMQRIYVAEFEKQKYVLEMIFSVISFSVVVLVFCIFHMMVRLKQKDIAIIKSCGAANSSVIGLFLGFGVSVGVAGSGLGAALGYLITRNINQIEGVDSRRLWAEALEEQRLHVRSHPEPGGLELGVALCDPGDGGGGGGGPGAGRPGRTDPARGSPEA